MNHLTDGERFARIERRLEALEAGPATLEPSFVVGERVKVVAGAADGGFGYITGCFATVLSIDNWPSVTIDVEGHGEFGSPARWLKAAT